MRQKASFALLLGALLASCTSNGPGYEVRLSKSRPVGSVNEAEGQLALGNTALALEGFRKSWRQNPSDSRAALGIATAYDRMGRYDLSRGWYEKALSVDPDNVSTLLRLAGSLADQGKTAEAQAVRSEAAARISGTPEAKMAALELFATMPAAAPATAASVTVKLAPAAPVDAGTEGPLLADQNRPKLHRLSLGEVALVTTGRAAWAELSVSTPYESPARVRPNTRILNAARAQGLAARARTVLAERGWRRIEIGDADTTREHSVVLYPARKRVLAQRLAAQFGFSRLQQSNVSELVLMLGRDAAASQSFAGA